MVTFSCISLEPNKIPKSMFVSFFIAVFYLTFNMEKMYNFLGNCGSGVRNLVCNQRADGSNPISDRLGCCVKPKRSLSVRL